MGKKKELGKGPGGDLDFSEIFEAASSEAFKSKPYIEAIEWVKSFLFFAKEKKLIDSFHIEKQNESPAQYSTLFYIKSLNSDDRYARHRGKTKRAEVDFYIHVGLDRNAPIVELKMTTRGHAHIFKQHGFHAGTIKTKAIVNERNSVNLKQGEAAAWLKDCAIVLTRAADIFGMKGKRTHPAQAKDSLEPI